MKLLMQESESYSQLFFSPFEMALMGSVIDDRGAAAHRFVWENSQKVVTLEYDPDEYTLKVDDAVIYADDIDGLVERFHGQRILLESTTLGFVELLLCARSFMRSSIDNFHIVYVEPGEYRRARRTALLNKRDFELSDEVPGYRGFPGATMMLTDKEIQRGVFFLGYEERRLDQALEDFQMINPDRCMAVFGVPAFKPGWEMDAFVNNIRVIRDKNIRGGIRYCGAENPKSAIDLLSDVYSSLENGERMFVVPIGTKPLGVGAALFAAAHHDVKVLYDHPRRRPERSKEVSRWHLYEVLL
jgi:hypothetical protein